ncbi:ABC transporter permease [Nocardia puris]|uniref:ABC transporter permease n=1 Tax=Nocardia puris TaxID=208602 RepID=UPI00189457E8|nr:ABC transporter permease [Nocardia puris]MBF6209690.1 ABC transporter permease [Nocardia puris]MBF6366262.1 ABC transporter permease [Nocardia puris]MBF6458399.1 ABC transporter permease [Nocardia puris]
MTASSYLPVGVRWVGRVRHRVHPMRPVETVGFVLGFCGRVLASVPFTLVHYRRQTVTAITDMTWGRGSVIIGGGVVPLMLLMGAAMGASIGIEAYHALDSLALGQLSGLISAFGVTRELAPIAAGVGFAAQAGCRMTAEIGSMRISEEIDALESLGIRSLPFVVTTRVIAGVIAVAPAFVVALLLSYLSCRLIVTTIHGVPTGTYDHYFDQFVLSWDVIAATIKVVIFAVAVVLIHSYQGYFAVGGPEGVGIGSGRAIRASLVAIIALDMVATIVLWGFQSPITFTG